MITTVEARSVGPAPKTTAQKIRNMQSSGRWGYWPQVFEGRGGWYVTMYGDRDAAEATAIIKGAK